MSIPNTSGCLNINFLVLPWRNNNLYIMRLAKDVHNSVINKLFTLWAMIVLKREFYLVGATVCFPKQLNHDGNILSRIRNRSHDPSAHRIWALQCAVAKEWITTRKYHRPVIIFNNPTSQNQQMKSNDRFKPTITRWGKNDREMTPLNRDIQI